MQTIKFSHKYEKMPDIDIIDNYDTILLEVFKVEYKDLSERFKQYDTLIQGQNPFYLESYYALPQTALIVLLLKTDKQVWTTVRRWTPEKEVYYRGLRGQEVKIEVKE